MLEAMPIMQLLCYCCLSISVFFCLLSRSYIATASSLLVSLSLAALSGICTVYALSVFVFWAMAKFHFKVFESSFLSALSNSPALRIFDLPLLSAIRKLPIFRINIVISLLTKLSLLLLVLLCLGVFGREFSGFNDPYFILNHKISYDSQAYSFRPNFFTVFCLVVMRLESGLFKEDVLPKIRDIGLLIKYFSLLFITLLIIGFNLECFRLDIKFPSFALLWMWQNLFFTSFSEEVLFREFIQNRLKKAFLSFGIRVNKVPLHVILVSLAFALNHIKFQPLFVFLVFVAGLSYSLIYEKSKNILLSILLHFLINLAHFVAVSYPYLENALPK